MPQGMPELYGPFQRSQTLPRSISRAFSPPQQPQQPSWFDLSRYIGGDDYNLGTAEPPIHRQIRQSVAPVAAPAAGIAADLLGVPQDFRPEALRANPTPPPAPSNALANAVENLLPQVQPGRVAGPESMLPEGMRANLAPAVSRMPIASDAPNPADFTPTRTPSQLPGQSWMGVPNLTNEQVASQPNMLSPYMATPLGTGAPGMFNAIDFGPNPAWVAQNARTSQRMNDQAALEAERLRSDPSRNLVQLIGGLVEHGVPVEEAPGRARAILSGQEMPAMPSALPEGWTRELPNTWTRDGQVVNPLGGMVRPPGFDPAAEIINPIQQSGGNPWNFMTTNLPRIFASNPEVVQRNWPMIRERLLRAGANPEWIPLLASRGYGSPAFQEFIRSQR